MHSDNKLPSGWAECQVDEIGVLIRGITYKKEQASDSPGPSLLPLLRANNINGLLNYDNLVYVPQNLIDNEQLIGKGDLVFAMSSGSLNLVGKSAQALEDFEGSCGAFCAILRISPLISVRFLGLVFQGNQFRRKISEIAKGSNINNLKREHILEHLIVLPPLAEQRRIVAKIEELFSELDQGIETLKQARAQLAVYRQALLKHAFEGKLTADWRAAHAGELESADELINRIRSERKKRYLKQLKEWEMAMEKWKSGAMEDSKPSKPRTPPLAELPGKEELAELPTVPEGWHWMRLGSCNVDVFDGPFGSNLKTSDYVGSGVRVVRLENIGVLKFIEEKESFVTEAKYKALSEHTVFPGDIVFSSFITERTRVAMVPPSILKAINKADCFCVRCHGSVLQNRLVCMLLSSRSTFKQLEAAVHGVGRPRINTTQLKELFIPVCSAPEQVEIMALVEAQFSELDALETDIDQNLLRAEALRQSILKKAFAGELLPQDPADEPASELLARIRAERESAVKAAKTKPVQKFLRSKTSK